MAEVSSRPTPAQVQEGHHHLKAWLALGAMLAFVRPTEQALGRYVYLAHQN